MVHSLVWLGFTILVTALLIVPEKTLMDGDTGWHIMAGHYIIENGQIPKNNIFSFTAENFAWQNMAWLADVLFALIDSVGGLYLVALITIILGGSVIAFLIWLCQNRGAGIIATVVSLILGLLVFTPMLLARPQIFTYLFVLLFMLVLNSMQRKWLVCLPIIMLLWVNMHGGFLAGFTLLGAYLLQLLWEKRLAEFKQLAWASIFCTAAVFINPLGVGIFDITVNVISGSMTKVVDEWQHPAEWNYFIYLGLFTLVFFASFRVHSLAEKILCAFWLFQACESVRNMPVFMLVSVPVMARGLQCLIEKRPKLLAKEIDYKNDFIKLGKVAVGMAILLPLIAITTSRFYPAGENYAEEEVGYILATMPEARVLNHYDYGGYMIYQSEGKLKTFIDGRAETAFSPEFIEDYMKFHYALPGWEKLLDKYQIDMALMPKGLGEQLVYFNNNWRLVYEGPKARVYQRQ